MSFLSIRDSFLVEFVVVYMGFIHCEKYLLYCVILSVYYNVIMLL